MKCADAYLDEWMKKWIISTARREHWKISWYDLEDLIQDGYVCYAKCRDRYILKEMPENPSSLTMVESANPTRDEIRTLMYLVKRTFMNHIYTLSWRHPYGAEVTVSDPLAAGPTPVQAEESTLFTMLVQAPAELRDLVDRILKDGLDGGAYLKTQAYVDKTGRWRKLRRGYLRETFTEHWTRVMGNPDQIEALVDYLSPEDQSPAKSKNFERLATKSRQYETTRHARFKALAETSCRYEAAARANTRASTKGER